MGRHTAADGAAAHPLVAAALAQRAADGIQAHRGGESSGEGGLGWPVAPGTPEPGDGGLGWPGGGSGQDTDDRAETAQARPRTGWRRLFGSSRAA
jgi:hypothetical protein